MSENKPSTSGLSSLDLSKLPRGAISMTGIPLGRNARLPSIKGPRDLTLGSGNKRVFTPNIPIRRERKPPQPNVTSASSRRQQVKTSEGQQSRPNNRGNRSRGRGMKNFVQMPGAVFGEGVSNLPKSSTYRDFGGPSGVTIQKPVINHAAMVKSERFDADDEAELSDKFIDDSDLGEDEDEAMTPVAVPLALHKITKKELKEEPAIEEQVDAVNVPKIKKEPGTETGHVELDPEMMEKLSLKPIPGELYLLNFPNCFLLPDENASSRDHAEQANGNSAEAPTSVPSASTCSSIEDNCIGKLQYMRSGRCRLVVGSQVYEAASAEFCPYLQQVASIKTQDSIDLSLLGNIKETARFWPAVNASFVQNSVKR